MSAPTTAEVAKRFDSLNRARVSSRINCEEFAEYVTLREVALPIAEHRDALAAEVARLRAILECGASPYGVHRCVHCDSEVT